MEDAVGEVVDLAGELHGVLLGAGDVDVDPGGAEDGLGGVVAGEVLALIGEGGHLQPAPGAVGAPVAAEFDSVAGGAGARGRRRGNGRGTGRFPRPR